MQYNSQGDYSNGNSLVAQSSNCFGQITGGVYSSPWVTTWPEYRYITVDKGSKAYEIIKKLEDKKLINLRSAKEFMDMMDAILETL